MIILYYRLIKYKLMKYSFDKKILKEINNFKLPKNSYDERGDPSPQPVG